MQVRFIRLRDAPKYLGMDVHRFNNEVRPYLTEIPIGKHGIAFDRLDIDAWADEYKECSGRPGKMRSKSLWDAKNHRDFLKEKQSGISISKYTDSDFEKVLALAASKRQNVT